MSARFKLTVSYIGTDFRGWERKRGQRTVQGELEAALLDTSGRAIAVQGAGRTDKGVHALGQVAHVDVPLAASRELLRQLNARLPGDISVVKVDAVSDRFDARAHAIGRSYIYQVVRARVPELQPFAWSVLEPLDFGEMRESAKQLLGTHDFRSFTDDDPSRKSTTTTLKRFDIHDHGEIVLLHLEATRFLWKMVRRLVAVVVEVGRGRLRRVDVEAMLAEQSEIPAKLTARAKGLFFHRAIYKDDDSVILPQPPLIPEKREVVS